MDRSSEAHSSTLSAPRLSRRGALVQAGAGIAAAVAAAQPGHILAQEASPVADPPASDAPGASVTGGIVSAERAALAVEQAPALAQQILETTSVPGMSVAIVHNDEVLFVDGFGVREVGQDAAIDDETVFQLASVSKTVSATVVSSVVADGAISWVSRMADVDPGFALHDAWPTQEVTLSDLFSHRSGLLDHAGDILEDLGYGRDEVLRRLRYMPPEYSFRAGYAYTNFGLTAAAVAVANSVGMSWEDLSAQRVYEPLGMDHTSSRFADYIAQPNRAVPHMQQDGAWIVTPKQRDPDAQSPAGGVSSTATDMAQWMRLQLGQGTIGGEELIPAVALAPAHIPQSTSHVPQDPATERAGFYGLGINVSYTDYGTVQWSHSGAFASGAATAFYMLPGSGFGVLALTNGSPIGAPEAFCLSIIDLAQSGAVSRDWMAVLGPVFNATVNEPLYGTGTDWATPPADAAPASSDEAYLGTYQSEIYGDVEIVSGDDGLVMRIGPEPREFALTHFTRDTFSWLPSGENDTGPSGLSFLLDGNGAAVEFHDEYLNQDGPGILERGLGANA